MSKQLISIVTPCFNEEKNVEEHFRRVKEAIVPFSDKYNFEHIYTDNCSTDNTYTKLIDLVNTQNNITAIKFSRNIGPNRAMFLGLSQAKGDAVILILADLEDPPEIIPQFIEGWQNGYEVVFGQIKSRTDGRILKYFRKAFYNIVSLLSEYPIPKNATEFRLVSRRVNEAVLSLSDENPYIRGCVAFVGYKQLAVPYDRAKRKEGKSSFNFWRLMSYALNGLTATTQAPLRLVSVLGFIITLLGFLNVVFHVVRKLMYPETAPLGFVTLISVITLFSGVQILSLGVVGEYIRKIYLQSLNRPKGFIESKETSFKSNEV